MAIMRCSPGRYPKTRSEGRYLMIHSYRWLIPVAALLLAPALQPCYAKAPKPGPIRVVIWDERQPAQKEAYSNFLGNEIAGYLQRVGPTAFTVKSVGLTDPDQGLNTDTLDHCDVLIWWGHQRHDEVKDELVKEIVHRIQSGKLSLIALHSAHWSKPFMQAMNARAIQDALKSLPPGQQAVASVVTIPADRRLMRRDEKLTPYYTRETGDLGIPVIKVKL